MNHCIYKDPNAPIEDRVKDLLSRMTLKEKIAQMTQIERRAASTYYLRDFGVGSLLNVGGSAPFEDALSSDWADMIDGYQKLALESRLGIPLLMLFMVTIMFMVLLYFLTMLALELLEMRICYEGSVLLLLLKFMQGIVISDWEGLNQLSRPSGLSFRQCISTAVNAGIDMDLLFLIESGKIPISRVDDAVERILRVKFVARLFEHPFADRSLLDMVGCKLHRELAREAVHKSLVLLKNGKHPKKPFLPLDKNAKKILVAGTHADDLGYQCGGWTKTWDGTSGRITIGTTILDAIKSVVGEKTEVIYEKNPSPETLASQDFSYAIVAVGESPYAEFTGDDSELIIPFNGADIINSVSDRIPTLAILISGRPLFLGPSILDKIDAFVAAWLPGTEGAGVTDVIFGDYKFQGKLPVSWFKSVKQLPMNKEANSYDPLFPFDFGLTHNEEKSSD